MPEISSVIHFGKSVSILSRAGVLAPMGAQGLQNTPPRPHTAVKPYSSATQRCQVREQATKIEARRWSSWPHRPRILKSKIWGIHLGQGIIYREGPARPRRYAPIEQTTVLLLRLPHFKRQSSREANCPLHGSAGFLS